MKLTVDGTLNLFDDFVEPFQINDNQDQIGSQKKTNEER